MRNDGIDGLREFGSPNYRHLGPCAVSGFGGAGPGGERRHSKRGLPLFSRKFMRDPPPHSSFARFIIQKCLPARVLRISADLAKQSPCLSSKFPARYRICKPSPKMPKHAQRNLREN